MLTSPKITEFSVPTANEGGSQTINSHTNIVLSTEARQQYAIDLATCKKYERGYVQMGEALWRIKNTSSFSENYRNFTEFITHELPNLKKSQAYEMVASWQMALDNAKTFSDMSENAILPADVAPKTAREKIALKKLATPQERVSAQQRADEIAAARGVPARQDQDVQQAVAESIKDTEASHLASVSDNSSVADRNRLVYLQQEVKVQDKDQAHLYAEECKQAAARYCQAMGYEQFLAVDAYSHNLSWALNMEVQLQANHAAVRPQEESSTSGQGIYVCQSCRATNKMPQRDIEPLCEFCNDSMTWFGEVREMDKLNLYLDMLDNEEIQADKRYAAAHHKTGYR